MTLPSYPIKPFVKWVGGKRQLLPVIESNLPVGLGTTLNEYVEPFLGGGAVFFRMLEKYSFNTITVGDLNKQLISTYKKIQTDPDGLIRNLKQLQTEYRLLKNETARKDFYLAKRVEYNTRIQNGDKEDLIPALFIFLNKTGFNGLYRVNKKGEFNVPFGRNPNPSFFDEINLRNINKRIQNVNFQVGGYETLGNKITSNSFIYIDPPYRPLTQSATFTSYTNSSFGDTQQIQLAKWVKTQHTKGAEILLSNSDPHNSDPDDDFFDDLYQWATVTRVSATRAVNSNPNGRGKITELLIKTY